MFIVECTVDDARILLTCKQTKHTTLIQNEDPYYEECTYIHTYMYCIYYNETNLNV